MRTPSRSLSGSRGLPRWGALALVLAGFAVLHALLTQGAFHLDIAELGCPRGPAPVVLVGSGAAAGPEVSWVATVAREEPPARDQTLGAPCPAAMAVRRSTALDDVLPAKGAAAVGARPVPTVSTSPVAAEVEPGEARPDTRPVLRC